MELNQTEINTLRQLEESLWVAETRYDRAYMERVLSPEFVEFGCSGRIYRRDEILPKPEEWREIKAALPLKEFQAHLISETVAQTTYISEVTVEQLQVCNRSSIWVKTGEGWRLRFHQGTPVYRAA